MADYSAQQDKNQIPSLLVVQGTAGTADTSGTAETLPVGGDPDTGAMYVYNLGPAGSVSLGDTPGGTLDLVSVIADIQDGAGDSIMDGANDAMKVNVVAGGAGGGAVYAGTPTDPGTVLAVRLSDGTSFYNAAGASDTPGGTLDLVTRVGNVGTLEVGTISSMPNVTVDTFTADIPGGTLDLVTTLTTVSTVAAIGQVHNAGTIAELPDVPGGTIDSVSSVGGTVAVNIVAGGAGDGAIQDGADSGIEATVLDYTNSNPLAVRLTDTDGNYVTASGAGTVVEVNNGTLSDVTITTLPDLPGGTVDNVGTVVGVGSVSNIAQIHNAGTIASLPNVTVDTFTADIPGGTLDSVTVTNGTASPLNTRLIDQSGDSAMDDTNNALRVNVVAGGAGGGAVYAGTPTDPGTVLAVRLSDGTSFYNAAGASDTPGGTLDLVTRVGNLGTLEVGTISSMPNVTVDTFTADIPGGTIDAVTAISNALPAGDNNIGNIDIASIVDIPGGTLDSVTVSNGTASPLPNTIRDETNGAIGASVLDYTNSNPLAVRLTDTDGNYVTASGGGTVVEVNDGTLSAVTITTLPDLPGGTVDNVGTVVGVGTISNVAQVHNAGTIQALPNVTVDTFTADIPGGTIDTVSEVSNLAGGTVEVSNQNTQYRVDDAHIGTALGNVVIAERQDILATDTALDGDWHHLKVNSAGALWIADKDSVLGNGAATSAQRVTLADDSTGTIAGVGTISDVAQVHNAGTIQALPNVTVDTFTADIPGGTIDSITNVAGGTVQINPKASQTYVTYGTTIASGSESTILSAPGSGTSHFIQNIHVVIHGTAASSAYVGWGTADAQGTQSIIRGQFPANGGVEKEYPYNLAATNTALMGSVSAGSVSVNLSYFTSA